MSEHGATVLRVCRAVLGSHADAEDAWSDTFVAALSAWPSLERGANVQAWLVTIAHRKALDLVRARGRRAVPVEHALEPPGHQEPDDDEVAALRTALAALPDKQRRVLAYHYLGGLPYADIAALVGGTPEAARRAAADGRRSLRTTLSREDAR